MGLNYLKAIEPEDSLLFITKSLEVLGTHLIDLRRIKSWADLGATQLFLTQVLRHCSIAPNFTSNFLDLTL